MRLPKELSAIKKLSPLDELLDPKTALKKRVAAMVPELSKSSFLTVCHPD
jgi:hypothetical protein